MQYKINTDHDQLLILIILNYSTIALADRIAQSHIVQTRARRALDTYMLAQTSPTRKLRCFSFLWANWANGHICAHCARGARMTRYARPQLSSLIFVILLALLNDKRCLMLNTYLDCNMTIRSICTGQSQTCQTQGFNFFDFFLVFGSCGRVPVPYEYDYEKMTNQL